MGRRYSIGELAGMLGVKAHVLRYWEEEIPFIAPRKDQSGRRVYGEREVQLLLRLKELLYRDRYTIEGARERIWMDLNPSESELPMRIAAIRRDLMNIWLRVRQRQA